MDSFLLNVRKPSRYSGGEFNEIIKNKDVGLSACFCFPDTYEIGMSCLGLQILYSLINELPYARCERAFAPWIDLGEALKKKNIPLRSLESGEPLSNFSILAFTLQYELSFTNVLYMLDLAAIPFRREERGEEYPIIIAGGPCAANPEPMAGFIDLFVIGEGEEVIVELMELFYKMKGMPKSEIIAKAAELEGVYAPELLTADTCVRKRIVRDLDKSYYPKKPLVPNTEIVHERVMLELFRGCIRGCRFCQAGYANRPVRVKTPQTLIGQGIEALKNTGYEEVGLVSLSTSDYPYLDDLCDGLLEYCEPRRISLSLPSLRADSFRTELLERVQKVRKSGLTFAPEAGSPRLRDVINKNLSEEDLLSACVKAFEAGYTNVKLYFMLGLPTETDEDVIAIAQLCSKVYQKWRQVSPDRSRGIRITASASFFVPKPHTPFQWEAQDTSGEFERKAKLLKENMRKQINFNWHDSRASVLEGALARGGRGMGELIERAYRLGAKMDGWGECFDYDIWLKAGLSVEDAARERDENEVLPWEHIKLGVTREHLLRERRKALEGIATPDCGKACSGCGLGCGK